MHLKNKQSGLTGILTCIEFSADDSESEIDLTIILDNSGGECIDRQFYSLDELKKFLRDWEECKPAEPLIKDEKIRKIVRAWAERCSFPLLEHYFSNGLSCFLCAVDGNDYCLDFNLRIDNLEGSKLYTITELCGEEE